MDVDCLCLICLMTSEDIKHKILSLSWTAADDDDDDDDGDDVHHFCSE